MLVCCWSVKGGSGVSVVSAALALVLARSAPGGVLLVDLGGDLPAVLGCGEPAGPGVTDWLGAPGPLSPEAWGRLEHPVTDGLGLVGRGSGTLEIADRHRAELLAALLADDVRTVVVDIGRIDTSGGDARSRPAEGELAAALLARASRSVLVTRACYLSLRRAARCSVAPSDVVLVSESWRALGPRDVAEVLGAPVVSEVPVVGEVARAVDAGILVDRMPRVLDRAVRGAL